MLSVGLLTKRTLVQSTYQWTSGPVKGYYDAKEMKKICIKCIDQNLYKTSHKIEVTKIANEITTKQYILQK